MQLSSTPREDEWEVALRLVQQLGTPGLGARDLAECLTLQLDALPEDTTGRALARRIVTEQIERLGRCDYAGLSRAFDCRSEEHTSELQSLMRISYAVFCLKKKIHT